MKKSQLNEESSVSYHTISLTLKSLGETQLAKLISTNMTTEEMENTIKKAMEENQRNNQQKANLFLAKVVCEQRLTEGQFVSNFDAGSEE